MAVVVDVVVAVVVIVVLILVGSIVKGAVVVVDVMVVDIVATCGSGLDRRCVTYVHQDTIEVIAVVA